MTGSRVLVDTAVFAYALGGEHRLRSACRAMLRAAADGRLELHATVEMVQELLFHRMRRTGRAVAASQARDAATLCTLLDFDKRVLSAAIELVAGSAVLGGRDAVHAATALVHGLPVILSPDRAFEAVPGLRRVDPADAVLELAG